MNIVPYVKDLPAINLRYILRSICSAVSGPLSVVYGKDSRRPLKITSLLQSAVDAYLSAFYITFYLFILIFQKGVSTITVSS